MKQLPDAEEKRRLRKIEQDKADKLPLGKERDAARKKAREFEPDAHSEGWRDSNLHSPK